jgi:hypothetical protein
VRNPADYIDLALQNPNVENSSDISRQIGVTPSVITRLKKGHTFLDDENMIRLADLAGIDRIEALIDLNRWRSTEKDMSEASSVYLEIAKRLGYLSLAVTLAVIFLGGDAVAEEARTLAEQTISEDPEFINCATIRRRYRRRLYRLLLPRLGFGSISLAQNAS